MIKYKEIEEKKTKRIKKVVEFVECDKCHKKIFPIDESEYQAIFNIHLICGYGSVFGDEKTMEGNFCQHCLKEVFGEYLREV